MFTNKMVTINTNMLMNKDQQGCMAATCSQSSTIARSAAGAFGGSDGRAPCRQTFTAILAGSKPLTAPLLDQRII